MFVLRAFDTVRSANVFAAAESITLNLDHALTFESIDTARVESRARSGNGLVFFAMSRATAEYTGPESIPPWRQRTVKIRNADKPQPVPVKRNDAGGGSLVTNPRQPLPRPPAPSRVPF